MKDSADEVPAVAYANRLPDESVNYSIEHPLSEFAWLAGSVIVVAVACSTLLIGFAGMLASRIPFRIEREFALKVEQYWCPQKISPEGMAAQTALRTLADRLVKAIPEANAITVKVYVDERPGVNAYATLGGNIVVFRELLQKLESEDAVAMVLAHEIAHAAHRHPAAHLGRGTALTLLLATFSVATGGASGSKLFELAGGLPLLKYGREQERDADAAAVAALVSVYGHAGGATDVFGIFSRLGGPSEGVEFLQTHPLTAHRAEDVVSLAKRNGWAPDGTRTPLPASLRDYR